MRNRKRVLSDGVVLLAVFLILGICKSEIDIFCQKQSIMAVLPERVLIHS